MNWSDTMDVKTPADKRVERLEAELSTVKAERDNYKNRLDACVVVNRQQWKKASDQQAEIVAILTARAEKAEAELARAVENMDGASAKTLDRLTQAEAKLKVADAMLSEIWGAYNRIGDALKMPEKQAVERGEV